MSTSDESVLADTKGIPATIVTDRTTHNVRSPPWWKIGGKDYSYVSIDGDFTATSGSNTSSTESLDDSIVKKRNSIYQAPEAVTLYRPPESYEGAHRFDPSLVWTTDEEKNLVKRVCVLAISLLRTSADYSQSSTGRSLCQLALCSSPFNWTVAMSSRQSLITS